MTQNEAARAQLVRLFDAGSFTELDRLMLDGEAAASVVCGFGLVNDSPVYAFAQDKTVCSGAVSSVSAAKIQKVYQLAAQNGAPVVGLFDSNGVRLDDGIAAMDAVAQILYAANELSGVVPQIAVVTGSCVGSAAMIAAAADVVIAVEDADYYLSADEPAKADVVAADVDAALEKARLLLDYLPANNLAAPVMYEAGQAVASTVETAAEAADLLADAGSLYPLYTKDNTKVALARINGAACGIVTLADEQIGCCAASHAARFVRFCDAFSIPVITVVDAAGFGSLKCAVKLDQVYAEATTAKITVIAGKAYGPVYIAVAGKTAGADAVLAWEKASVSALAPETAVPLLWSDRLAAMADPTKERAALVEEYRLSECNVQKAAEKGAVTDVIAVENTRQTVAAYMEMLLGKRVSKLPKKHANIRL